MIGLKSKPVHLSSPSVGGWKLGELPRPSLHGSSPLSPHKNRTVAAGESNSTAHLLSVHTKIQRCSALSCHSHKSFIHLIHPLLPPLFLLSPRTPPFFFLSIPSSSGIRKERQQASSGSSFSFSVISPSSLSLVSSPCSSSVQEEEKQGSSGSSSSGHRCDGRSTNSGSPGRRSKLRQLGCVGGWQLGDYKLSSASPSGFLNFHQLGVQDGFAIQFELQKRLILWDREGRKEDGLFGGDAGGAGPGGAVPEQGGGSGQDLQGHPVRLQVHQQRPARHRAERRQVHHLGSQGLPTPQVGERSACPHQPACQRDPSRTGLAWQVQERSAVDLPVPGPVRVAREIGDIPEQGAHGPHRQDIPLLLDGLLRLCKSSRAW